MSIYAKSYRRLSKNQGKGYIDWIDITGNKKNYEKKKSK
jgi:hypothetical protein